jgi:hypothetical protein
MAWNESSKNKRIKKIKLVKKTVISVNSGINPFSLRM